MANILKAVLNRLKSKKKAREIRDNWRANNSHNNTFIVYKDYGIVKVGNQTYGAINVKYFRNVDESLTIGHYCSIADEVVFLTGGNHTMKTFSQFPFDAYFKTGRNHQAPTKGQIVVEDDVWIGYGSTILSGVTIGQGAVIGAKSVVTKDVPPYAVFVGNKVIKYRYPQNIIDKMVKFDFSKLTPDDIIENSHLLDKDVDESFFETDFYKNHLKD